MKLLLLLLAPYLLIILCEPPTRIAALKFHNSTETELVLFIENDPKNFGEDTYQEYPIGAGQLRTLYCFAYSRNPVRSYVDDHLFGRNPSPTFGIKIDDEVVKEWVKPTAKDSENLHSPYNKKSWKFESEYAPISCEGHSDNGSSIVFEVNESVFNKN